MLLDLGLLLLRVSAGSLMLMAHGLGKINQFNVIKDSFLDPIGIGPLPSILLAIFAEFFCSALVILGIKTRWSSIPIIVTMLVAFFIVHKNDPFSYKELPLTYAIIFITLFFTGGGRFSLDRLFTKKNKKH